MSGRQITPSVLDSVLGAPAPTLTWDYLQIEDEPTRKRVRSAAVQIKSHGQRMRESVFMTGQRLIEVKEALPHGQFGDWIATEFGMSDVMAQNFMRVAREFGDKSETVSFLTDSALYLLAGPSVPEAARDEVIAQSQERQASPTKAEVKKVIEKHRRLFAADLVPLVQQWINEAWAHELPENPSHTNGTFWRRITAWFHDQVNETWTEADLKFAIKQVAEERKRRAEAAQWQAQRENRQVWPTREQTAAAFAEWVQEAQPGAADLVAMRDQEFRHPLFSTMIGALMEKCGTVVGIDSAILDELITEYVDGVDEVDEMDGGGQVVDVQPSTPSGRPMWEAVRPSSDARAEKLRDWLDAFQHVLDGMRSWGDLTGRHSATGEAERGLRTLLAITERELALLNGESVAESGSWGEGEV